ncbi:PREDICTED: TOM1-like protein 2 isoform X2 [Nelumbo nucifera]|nr:PREDICTED: TOM1-like protein 2 isoform X2 [Nelumbo nucifera]XP_010264486.1 PREDICTED: TOM1-like protein 2 isoform X2 [Nelumbo nucifera]XP_010264487.1 PREDICTED: TOM1-like protein 2 isoform X2 [Nelumbo nucifera]
MVKIVKKQMDMNVRDKILVLLDSWQEAFGGPGGKYPQYYWAYEELRRSGVEFPQRSSDAAPIFTPPVTHPMPRHIQAGYGMPSNTTRRLDEAMASEVESLSLSNIDSMWSIMELLTEMLQAVNPNDREALKDEVIADLVSRCHSNQRRLMQMLNSTVDEEVLGQGLALNDNLQSVLAKHDSIASGSSLPTEVKENRFRPSEVRDTSAGPLEIRDAGVKPSEVRETNPGQPELRDASPKPNMISYTPMAAATKAQLEEEEEEDDDFAQLARRRSKTTSVHSQSTSSGLRESSTSLNMTNVTTPSTPVVSTPSPSKDLALPNPPTSIRTTTKEQDMIDLLSITLSTTSTSPHTPLTLPSASNHDMHQIPVSPTTQGYPYGPQIYPGNQGQVSYNSYVVPWAQAQPQFPQYSSSYPPPPWATAPAGSDQGPSTTPYTYMTPHANAAAIQLPLQITRSLQHFNSFPSVGSSGSTIQKEAKVSSTPRNSASVAEQKPFIPSYRLFEDLNVLGNADRGFKKTTNNTSPSLSGTPGKSMVNGGK